MFCLIFHREEQPYLSSNLICNGYSFQLVNYPDTDSNLVTKLSTVLDGDFDLIFI